MCSQHGILVTKCRDHFVGDSICLLEPSECFDIKIHIPKRHRSGCFLAVNNLYDKFAKIWMVAPFQLQNSFPFEINRNLKTFHGH